MGTAIAALAQAAGDTELAGIWTRNTDLDELLKSADVIIDFSLPAGTERVIDAVARSRKPLVCGVTGLSAAQIARLGNAALEVALVYDRNMSQGIAVLTSAMEQIGASLPVEFAVSVAEVHHKHKKDAPSGTALKLAETLAAVRQLDVDDIDISSVRRGEVPGDHRVTFESASERLTLTHSVTAREVFAAGAIRAARWVVGQPAGLYTMRDVLPGRR